MTNLLGISGKMGSGKNAVATIIQGVNASLDYDQIVHQVRINKPFDSSTGFEQKAFADKLKNITCLLIGCTREDLENQEFKEKPLGEEWWKATHTRTGEVISYQEFLDRKYVHVGKWKVTKMNPRLLMQLMGTECGRDTLHPNLWINSLFANYIPRVTKEDTANDEWFHVHHPKFSKWIISDLRYENECKAIKDRGGTLIRVNRETGNVLIDNDTHAVTDWQHISETALDDYQGFDYVLNNDSDIPALIEKVKEILKQENII